MPAGTRQWSLVLSVHLIILFKTYTSLAHLWKENNCRVVKEPGRTSLGALSKAWGLQDRTY